jgi:hypothetical protein
VKILHVREILESKEIEERMIHESPQSPYAPYAPSPVTLSKAKGLGVGGPEILRYAQNDTA